MTDFQECPQCGLMELVLYAEGPPTPEMVCAWCLKNNAVEALEAELAEYRRRDDKGLVKQDGVVYQEHSIVSEERWKEAMDTARKYKARVEELTKKLAKIQSGIRVEAFTPEQTRAAAELIHAAFIFSKFEGSGEMLEAWEEHKSVLGHIAEDVDSQYRRAVKRLADGKDAN